LITLDGCAGASNGLVGLFIGTGRTLIVAALLGGSNGLGAAWSITNSDCTHSVQQEDSSRILLSRVFFQFLFTIHDYSLSPVVMLLFKGVLRHEVIL
jgi:hypothetical protein